MGRKERKSMEVEEKPKLVMDGVYKGEKKRTGFL